MERLSACELLDRNDRQSGNINPDSAGLCSTWPDSKRLVLGSPEQLDCTVEVCFERSPLSIRGHRLVPDKMTEQKMAGCRLSDGGGCWFRFKTATDSHYVIHLIFFLVLPLNSTEADEETEDGDSHEREGGGETDSKAEVEVESEAEAEGEPEGEPEGEAEHTITHLTGAERLPDVSHKPSGAHQEGAEM